MFNNGFRDYVRPLGPGVLVGQLWEEGRGMDFQPQKVWGEFVLVKRYDSIN